MNELYFLGMDIIEETNALVKATTAACTNGMTENELSAYTMGIKNAISALAGVLDNSDLPIVNIRKLEIPTELSMYELEEYCSNLY